MIAKLLILVPVALFLTLAAVIEWSFGITPWVLGGGALLSYYGIIQVVLSHFRFKVVGDLLVLENFGQRASAYELSKLVAWRELAFTVRGQQRRTLLLFFNAETKVTLDNSEYPEDYQELYSFLESGYRDKRQETI